MTREKMGSFSFDVAERILAILMYNGKVKRSNLALKARLNYNVCLRYVNMLRILGWIEGDSEVYITEVGKEIRERLLNPLKSYHSVTGKEKREIAYKKGSLRISPLYQSRGSQSHISSKLKPSSNQPKKYFNIMIVDDEPDVALTFESFLSFVSNYKVETFSDPYDALREFALDPSGYDLIILDIRMPQLNGLQLYQSLKVMNPSCKILFISSLDAAKELLSMFPEIESDNIVKKPIEKELFIKLVDLNLRNSY